MSAQVAASSCCGSVAGYDAEMRCKACGAQAYTCAVSGCRRCVDGPATLCESCARAVAHAQPLLPQLLRGKRNCPSCGLPSYPGFPPDAPPGCECSEMESFPCICGGHGSTYRFTREGFEFGIECLGGPSERPCCVDVSLPSSYGRDAVALAWDLVQAVMRREQESS